MAPLESPEGKQWVSEEQYAAKMDELKALRREGWDQGEIEARRKAYVAKHKGAK